MSTSQTAIRRLTLRTLLTAVAALAVVGAAQRYGAPAVGAQGPERDRARVPVADEYYPVKTDWIGTDRSVRTIKHRPSGSCYILVYPSGDQLVPVEKDRCGAPTVALEK